MLGRSILACAVVAVLFPVEARAQTTQSAGDFAAELAYTYCPKLTDGSVKIGGPELRALGFTGAPIKMTDQRVGAATMLGVIRADGEVTIAVGNDSVYCQVNVIDTPSASVYPKMRAGLSRLGKVFTVDPASSGVRGAATVETLKSRLTKDSVLNVQFIQGKLSGGAPITGFQMIVLDQ